MIDFISLQDTYFMLNCRFPIQKHSSTFKVCYFGKKYPYLLHKMVNKATVHIFCLYFEFSSIADTATTMFVNILPQRWWIRHILSNEERIFKLWSRDKEMDTRNRGFSKIDGNFRVLFFPLMLSYHGNCQK